MKAIFALLTALSIINSEVSIGKILQTKGYIKKTNINCQEKSCSKTQTISRGERIITSKDSAAQILLNDGTAIIIFEKSDIIISRIKLRERDKPTEIYIERGKIKVIQDNSFTEASLIIKTPVAVIKSVKSEISIATGTCESAVFVYTGEAGVASNFPSVDRAYIVKAGYETFIKKENPPSRPVEVKKLLQGSWIGRTVISQDNCRVKIYNRETSIVDWPFIHND